MDITITINDKQAETGAVINKDNLRELCERTIAEQANEWERIKQVEEDRSLLEKLKSASPFLLAQVKAVVVPIKSIIAEEPIKEEVKL